MDVLDSESVETNFNELKSKFKKLAKTEAEQVLTSASSWTTDKLLELINSNVQLFHKFDIEYQSISDLLSQLPCVNLTKSAEMELDEKIFPKIWYEFTRNMETMNRRLTPDQKPLHACFKEILEIGVSETAIRSLINALLLPILEHFDNLEVVYEETIKCSGLPTSVLDYLIRTKEGKAIGVIEAEKIGKMTDKSLVQAIIQLFCLRTCRDC